ncbi:PLP-dependent cysteine synthase family protein [Gallaecimonas kandeliae]|uniref:PLP-dependent cysteine synthase family protein n=1 Tax=Gallaecimonas kandeliae TaxID=3029055 RepID=UPI0026471AFD|nr:PLP-dependent cysteine synthase family protein [Gallaecimonas kandeliae]WKE64782.1 PLP-dependent cysteine synthase family protein [Gallaecimonas kandeliae]
MPRPWVSEAIHKIEADFQRSADTHLLKLDSPAFPGIQLYLKDESSHPTGSLKHRLARSLFLYGLCNGWITEGKTIIEASSGSTAVSEAYFARLLGLPFIAVIPKGTSREKIAKLAFYGGRCHLVDCPADINAESHRLAAETGGHFVDQFTHAERATDWRGNNNIAETLFNQMAHEPHPEPHWLVMSAGTGGTSATLGRHIRYARMDSRLLVVDPENSAFFDYYQSRDPGVRTKGSRIEGIGRPHLEPSFMPDVIDEMLRVPDEASLAAMLLLEELLGRKVGGSSGTNFYGALVKMKAMADAGQEGSIATLICDQGERYLNTYYDPDWRQAQGLDVAPWLERLRLFWQSGQGL